MEIDDHDHGHAVRTLLRSADVPPTRLTTGRLLADARRSRRNRRWVAAAATATAVLAAVPAVMGVVGGRETRDAPPDFAASVSVVRRAAPPPAGPGPACPFTPYPRVDQADYGGVFDADSTGELVVGASRGGVALTLWRRERPTLLTIEGRQSTLTAVAVNSAGTIAGWDQTAPTYNWRYRDGVTTRLPHPAGYASSTVREINERGDALGWISGDVGLVIWPAEAVDRPRVIAEQGLLPLAIRGDGTVIAFRQTPPGVVIFRPDGTTLSQPAPDGVRADLTSFVRGDMFFTAAVGAASTSHPVRWNLRTGSVEIFTGVRGAVTAGNTAGWMVVTDADSATLAVTPDGAVINRDIVGQVVWISAAGGNMIGVSGQRGPGAWRCG